MEKKVSVIVACYNHADFLPQAVGSVIAQTYTNWECIIINDGSTDNSEVVASSLINSDHRIKYFTKPNGGLSSARNFGIEKSNGEYILPLDADDKIHPGYIEKALNEFKNEKIKIVYCEAEYFGAREGKVNLPAFSRKGLAEMNMIFCSAMYKRKDFDLAGGYNPNMIFGWEDWNLWVAILKNGGEVIKIPEVLFYYRIKVASMLKSLEGARKQTMFMQLYLNHPDFFDQFYDEPIEIFDKYRSLKDAYLRLRDLVTLKPTAIAGYFKNLLFIKIKTLLRTFNINLC